MRKIIYPGTFDPITNGHLDIAERTAKLFDELIIIVANNPIKHQMFSAKERINMIEASIGHLNNAKVMSTNGLITKFAKENDAIAIVRGLRHVSDFEFEFQMAMMNYKMEPGITTIFMMPDEKYIHLNSSILKDIARLKGDISDYVPSHVEERILNKLNS